MSAGSLASLELLEVPVADLHVAVVLVHALSEGLGSTGAVVGLVVVPGLFLGSGSSLDGRRSSGLGGATAEETTDGMADGGTDSNTTERDVSDTWT